MANPSVVGPVSVAVPGIDRYEAWAPVANTALDLRLARGFKTDKIDQLLCEKAKEMKASLHSLYTHCANLSITSLKVLHEHCPQLKHLNLRYAYQIEEQALDVIAQFPELEMLNLDNANLLRIEDHGTLARSIPTNYVNDAVVKKILDSCPRLQKLDLSGSKITKASLPFLAQHPTLTFVRLNLCFQLERHEIERFASENPHLSIDTDLHLRDDPSEVAFEALVANVKSLYVRKDDSQEDKSDKSVILSEATPNKDCINPDLFR